MFASVIVDIQNSEVDKVFDYLVPLSLDLHVGDRVKVPFGGRLIEGFVVGLKEQSDVPAEKIKEVFCKLDSFSAITPEMLALMDYMRDEFFLKMVDVLKLFIPSGMRGGKVKSIIKDWCFISKDKDIEEIKNSLKKNAKSQLELVEYLCIYRKRLKYDSKVQCCPIWLDGAFHLSDPDKTNDCCALPTRHLVPASKKQNEESV